jgi:hypothetical protein
MTDANANMLHYITAGERLWNGATVSAPLAAAYNRLTDKIAAYDRAGRKAPEHILNGRHNLLAGNYNWNHR